MRRSGSVRQFAYACASLRGASALRKPLFCGGRHRGSTSDSRPPLALSAVGSGDDAHAAAGTARHRRHDGPSGPRSRAEQTIVVNLWATWCPPCQRLRYPCCRRPKPRGDVHFVFVNQGESAQQVACLPDLQRPAQRATCCSTPEGDAGTALGHRARSTTFFDAEGRLPVDTRLGELSEALARRAARQPSSFRTQK